MMTLLNIADMLADILSFEDVYAGNLDGNLKCAIGVYNSKQSTDKQICLGGKAQTKTNYKHISILIHWTDNPTACEEKAEVISDLLSDIRDYSISGNIIKFIQVKDPQDVGKDDKGICEFVVEATIIYERK